jgi:CubicO group peptidase (beta-lactamase class C family)
MRHRVGSISKTFTSVAIMQQVERGRIGLDAPVTDYVPDLFEGSGADRERGDAITVRVLLNHTSHIADYVLGAFPPSPSTPPPASTRGVSARSPPGNWYG